MSAAARVLALLALCASASCGKPAADADDAAIDNVGVVENGPGPTDIDTLPPDESSAPPADEADASETAVNGY
jgi:hypothetical protein